MLGEVGGSKEGGRGEQQLNYTNLVCAVAKIYHSVYHTTHYLNLHHVCVFANKYHPFDVEKSTNCEVGMREEGERGREEGVREGGGRE